MAEFTTVSKQKLSWVAPETVSSRTPTAFTTVSKQKMSWPAINVRYVLATPEVDFVFSSGEDFFFSDGSDYLFSNETYEIDTTVRTPTSWSSTSKSSHV